ncbi:MAG: hypothetical protein UW68_C0054G0002 [Candidatus Collierbacteria bacterium GW2011_GWB1_44_6]|uniref:Uncharacterized protein n=2 Tax=Candidatus Collieribacteriota TaxID=1752725 RepID=A0A0G1LSM2_9BACT|nr:MAG: hypothetical protein UV68_C0007G0015 [Candidatus Collierbacteria bacterium GW2011_GWC2_43_12]KKT71852.1 MAG: hypothetical protein UW68_C0054G0002 [Candidatus Collierbacteria bacterium GW2011_GWB1_44_6]KKT83117.1 MAG: hypothetical protein UW80_C0021G0007 [Microgenomates group bacterium GW2011_GWC1_44_9]
MTSLEKFVSILTPNRQLLAANLLDKNWFKNTDISVQKAILSLPDDHEGFVFDLSNRPDMIGSLEIVKLIKFVEGDYLIIPVFEVYSHTSKKTFTKEYVSWKMGHRPGIKGVLFVETSGKITHFINIEADKFPVAAKTYDAVGGIFQYTKQEVVDLPSQIQNILKKKLGLNKLDIKRFIDLGNINTDNGLTINYPGIFAAIIDGKEAQNLVKIHPVNDKIAVKDYLVSIIPIEQLSKYISGIDDAFFLSIVARLLAKKVISL